MVSDAMDFMFGQGIKTVERAVINKDKGKYNLLVEGYKFAHLLTEVNALN